MLLTCYFNNGKICKFEEVSGCMFRHDVAPLCQKRNCRFPKCQFSHTKKNDNESYSAIENVDEDDNESDSDSDKEYTLENEIDQPETTTKEFQTNLFRCDYGLCDFQQILKPT